MAQRNQKGEANIPNSGERKGRTRLRSWWAETPPGQITSLRTGEIVCGDALGCLEKIRSEIADIVFLDPPFNLGKSYGGEGPRADRMDEGAYLELLHAVLQESVRILKPGGALFLYHIPRWAIRLLPFLEEALTFRHWIAVAMKNGFVRGKSLYPAHYALLYYTKGSPAVFCRPKIPPATCPHCAEYVRDYGGYRQHVEGGVNLSDVWDDLSPVRHRKYKTRGANELPILLPKRVIEISGRRGGLFVDPFAGAGSAIVAARAKRMRFIAIDRETESCDLIKDRLREITARNQKRAST